MTIPGLIIKKNDQSIAMLSELFNEDENPIACANYGVGDHCNTARVVAKVEVWGARGEKASEDDCMVARVLKMDSKTVAMFNIGVTGTPPTVIDRANNNGAVYELSGAFVKDSYFANGFLNNTIASDLRKIVSNCKAGEKYTKAIVTFNPKHPYQEKLLSSAGFAKITQENIDTILGQNSFHPEKFKFKEEQVLECIAKEGGLVSHINWHDSKECTKWVEKTMMVSEVSDHHFQPYDEL